MPLIVGLYSATPQAGKSTASKALALSYPIDVVKISGAMKAMCAAAIAPFVQADEMEDWVDGRHKDAIVPGLDATCAQNPAVAQALIAAMGVTQADPAQDLPLCDRDDRPLTQERIEADLILIWGPILATIYANTGGLTPRDLQKTLGLEIGRALYGSDFWIRLVRSRIAASTAEIIIIDDVRFPDDAGLVRAHGGVLVNIIAPVRQKTDAHPSEGLLKDAPFDVVLDNTSSIEDYHARIAAELMPVIAGCLERA